MRNIKYFDTLIISEEAKSYAEATFMKKKMYYNMRIKTMKRIFSTLQKIVLNAKDYKLDNLDEIIGNLDYKLSNEKDIKLSDLDEKIEECENIEKIYENLVETIQDLSIQSEKKLITELETGGNIRC